MITPGQSGYSTSFPATENPISQSGKWICGGITGLDWTNPQTTGGLGAYGTQTPHTPPPYDDSIAHLDPTKFSIGARQWAQGTLFNNSAFGGIEAELLLDFSISAHSATGYEIDLVQALGLVQVVRWDGPLNAFTQLLSATSGVVFTTGAVWYAQIDASGNITVKCNGMTVLTVTDSTYANQANRMPGLGFYRDTNNGAPSAANTFGWDSWSCGTF